MTRCVALLSTLAIGASLGGPVAAQTRQPQVAAPVARPVPVAPPLRSAPLRVSPYGSNQPFPPPRFWSELISKEFTREALDASHQTREVNLANKASVMIDRGQCEQAEDYLNRMGAPSMAARVPQTCDAKRRGLL